jgi:hypothetical protein
LHKEQVRRNNLERRCCEVDKQGRPSYEWYHVLRGNEDEERWGLKGRSTVGPAGVTEMAIEKAYPTKLIMDNRHPSQFM